MGLNHIFCVKNLIHSITTIRISNLLTDHAKKHAFYYTDGLIGLRGFAAFWVLIYHVWITSTPRRLSIEIGSGSINSPPFFSCGWAGVDIFYTLFGFHLTLPFARAAIENIENPGLWHYFRRRILRIFPAYYAQLGILLCLAWMRRIFHRSADLWHRCKLPFWEIPIWKQIHHIFGCCQL